MKLSVQLNTEEINNLQFPIVVESWDKKNGGRVKRAWLKEFNAAERVKAYKLYRLFYNWYLVKGTPENKHFLPETIQFIERLVNFFATV